MLKIAAIRGLIFAGACAMVLTVAAPSARADDRGPMMSYDWSGLYLGMHAGYGFNGDTTWTNTVSNSGFTDYAVGASDSHDMEGFIGGGQIGYNIQMGSFVFGPEVTLSGTDINDTSLSTVGVQDDVVRTHVNLLFTAVARLGFTMDNWLFYANGGYAGADVNMNVADTVGIAGSWRDNRWHSGYTVGGGIEYMFDWFVIGVEYRYIDLGTKTHSATGSTGAVDAFKIDVDEIHAITARMSVNLGPMFGGM